MSPSTAPPQADSRSSGRAGQRVAIMSLHSHSDRSFLDDRGLAVLSGELRQLGYLCDHLVAVLEPEAVDAPEGDPALDGVLELLDDYDLVVYERIFSRGLAEYLRARRPDVVWVHLRGEHDLEDPPAEYVLEESNARGLAALVDHVSGTRASPPRVRIRASDGSWQKSGTPLLTRSEPLPFRPNLKPRVVNPEKLPEFRSFAIMGNAGCPYQADARENPLYEGVELPAGLGRGCAFCTTGNNYEGHPRDETLEIVLEQIRFVRAEAPHFRHLVLKDQNPFSYLTELVEACEQEKISPFTMLLETRADWFLRSGKRLERALEACGRAGYSIAPYLVGIENFSQPELDRYNKGISAQTNIDFLKQLWSLQGQFGEALNLELGAFGFVLFNPWTTLQDLRVNHDAIRETEFHRLRGHVLLSRARLYPDTALYYLAQHDGLFIDQFLDQRDDPSRRYGYFPSHPWRFADDSVAHFATLATQLSERTGGRDHMTLFQALLEEFEAAADPTAVQEAGIVDRYESLVGATGGSGSAVSSGEREEEVDPALRERFGLLLRPLDLRAGFAGGWVLRRLTRSSKGLAACFALDNVEELRLRLEVRRPATPRAGFFRSRHYDVFYDHEILSAGQRGALEVICRTLSANDR